MQRKYRGKQKKKALPSQEQRLVQKDEVPRVLPPLQDQLAVGFVLRFITTANFTGQYTVTYTNLLDSWFVAGSATTAWQLFDFVRVKKVTIRGVAMGDPALTLAPTCTVGVEFPGLVGGQVGGGKQKVQSGMGLDAPALLSLRPDPLSQGAQFQPSTSNAAFVIRAVDARRQSLVGAIIDVQVVFRNSADVSPAAISSARAGMTSGQQYFGGIDGLAPATTQAISAFVPRA